MECLSQTFQMIEKSAGDKNTWRSESVSSISNVEAAQRTPVSQRLERATGAESSGFPTTEKPMWLTHPKGRMGE